MKKTMENLAKAFIGESQARNRYTLYSKVAKKEGYDPTFRNFPNYMQKTKESTPNGQ